MFMKIEFDLPKFEKEININIIIRKDGEVVETITKSSTSPVTNNSSFVTGSQKAVDSLGAGTVINQSSASTPKQRKSNSVSGNMMDPSLFN